MCNHNITGKAYFGMVLNFKKQLCEIKSQINKPRHISSSLPVGEEYNYLKNTSVSLSRYTSGGQEHEHKTMLGRVRKLAFQALYSVLPGARIIYHLVKSQHDCIEHNPTI